MNPFHRLPGHVKTPPGLEADIWRRLPAVLWWGTLLPLLVAWVHHGLAPSADVSAGSDAALLLWDYTLIGVVAFHWSMVLTLGVGCFIVRVMKGPAYVADAYPRPEWGDDAVEPRRRD